MQGGIDMQVHTWFTAIIIIFTGMWKDIKGFYERHSTTLKMSLKT
jgi:hypothetical protein